jgi:hypothetical protein
LGRLKRHSLKTLAPKASSLVRSFVERYLKGEQPLGKQINALMDRNNPFGEIVGVVGDVKEGSVDKEPAPTVYYIHNHLSYPAMTFVVPDHERYLGTQQNFWN